MHFNSLDFLGRATLRRQRLAMLAGVSLVLVLAGCASPSHRAPVEERPNGARAAGSVPAATPSGDASKPLPGAENAGKPGFYTVKPGDTLIRIGLEAGQNWRDIVKWNNLDNPNVVEVGQVLRVVPPGIDPTAAAARGVSTAKVEARPLDSKPPAAASAPIAAPVGNASAPAAAAGRADEDEVNWLWPATGTVLAGFDEARNKGLAIGGKAGDPVFAAADGRVVYAGSGLRGYGNLVIIKHNNTYLTAYAHNQVLMVKEDQAVRRGQKIAEMGSTDSDRVQLHFEVRKQGKPVDPTKLLPPR